MRPEQYDPESLIRLLRQRKIATMDDLKEALGTSADATVFRKLAELDYRSSYSHRGRYYTLDEIARFDELGLWSFRQVWFSRFGTLVSTVEALVDVVRGRLRRRRAGSRVARRGQAGPAQAGAGRAPGPRAGGRTLCVSLGRRLPPVGPSWPPARSMTPRPAGLSLGPGLRVLPDELKAAIVLFYSLLDERQRRLYAGLEAMKIGHGGDTQVAELLGIDPATVARGRRELLAGDIEPGRVRRPGGGRPSAKKASPR